ncbi:MAG: hypothetical protein ACPHHS_07925, partial [Candidatus Poseidoniaceae archaeon]
MTDEKKSKFAPLYFLGLTMFFLGGDLEILVFLGMFTIFFTSLAHLIVKIVTLQEGFNAGNPVNHQPTRSMFSSQRPRGNPSYDQLIRKMQVSDLSGMSVEQATSTYASFFNCGDLASKPFFSSPYVQQVLNIGAVQASPEAIAGSYSSSPPTESSSSGAFWSSMPESSTEAIEVCANPTCSTPVTV